MDILSGKALWDRYLAAKELVKDQEDNGDTGFIDGGKQWSLPITGPNAGEFQWHGEWTEEEKKQALENCFNDLSHRVLAHGGEKEGK